ncbi:MAG: M14-type cytosolic carboxypeptidase [Pseudomonadota bacterium]
MIGISSAFDGGHITIVDAKDPDDIRLALADDNASDFKQWFYFRLTGARDRACTIRIVNAEDANTSRDLVGMPAPWADFQAVASYDRETWLRVPTALEGDALTIRLMPERDSVYIAAFAPYPLERQYRFAAKALESPHASLTVLGQSVEGRDIDMLQFGTPGPNKRACWITTRQHPNETMGPFCVEGIVDRLIDPDDPLARALLDRAVFYVAPNLNPDGSVRGNTRTNAAGINLNRVWSDPSMETSPEIHLVRDAMHETGLDWSLDIHGWNGTHNFLGGPLGLPSLTDKQTALWKRYEAALAQANPDFEVGWPYPGGGPGPGEADLSMSWNYLGETFDAVALLYELLFKDTAKTPDPLHGWSPARSYKFGHSTLDALYAIIDNLR